MTDESTPTPPQQTGDRPVTAEVQWSDNFDADLVGQKLQGNYELRKVLGEGGMGRVYLAHQALMDRFVAVKVLHPSFAKDPRAVSRFMREVKAASRLAHPNTIRIYDFGKADDLLFMVLEVLKGRSLADIIDGDGPLPTRRALKVAMQICDSLAEAHAAGVIHRDLKPDNVYIEKLFGNPDHVKVLDFGIAKLQQSDTPSQLDTKTDMNMICGTPSYMSPEQIDGRAPVDARTDVYGLGTLLYEMLRGNPPFYSAVPFDVLLMQINDTPPSLPVSTNVPASLVALVDSMLAKAPDDRPADCTVVRAELEMIAEKLDARQPKTSSSSDQTLLFGTGLVGDGLEGPTRKKRLVSGRRRHTPTHGYEAAVRPGGTTVARKGTPPSSPSPFAHPNAAARIRQATPLPNTAKTRRIVTGQMQGIPASARKPPTDPQRLVTAQKPFPSKMATGEQVVAKAIDDLTPKANPRMPTSRRLDVSTLRQHGDLRSQPKPSKAVRLPMRPTRVALQHLDSGDKFDLIATNEIQGVLQCLSSVEPAVGTRLTLAGAETRFVHVEALVLVEGPAPDVPGKGFLQIRWQHIAVRSRVMHMEIALDALLSVNPDTITGWPTDDALDTGTMLLFKPESGILKMERARHPEMESLAERARRPSKGRGFKAVDPPGVTRPSED